MTDLTLLSGDGLPGINAESFTVTEDDDLLGWVVRHPHATVGPTGWRAIAADGRVAAVDVSYQRIAVAALGAS